MPVSWQTRFLSSSAIWTFLRIVDRTRCPVTDVSRYLCPLTRCARVIRAQLVSLLRDAPTAAAGRKHDRCRVERVLAAPRAPAVRRALELLQRRLRERLHTRRVHRV